MDGYRAPGPAPLRRAAAAAAVIPALLVLLLALAQQHPVAATASPQVVSYIDKVTSWWPPAAIAKAIGVPGAAAPNKYTAINLAFWLTSGPADAALVWSDALKYVSPQNPWGNTTAEVQATWLKAFHSTSPPTKVLVSAFGSTEAPVSSGMDPVNVATDLAQFVTANQLDGADIDFEDNGAMNAGKAEAWLISFTQQLRKLLPSPKYIISHAPQAPYFMGKPHYPSGGYVTIDKAVGSLVDWYNVQFYNQGTSVYGTYATLFEHTDGWATNTSVCEILAKGVPASRILIGKPVGPGDATNTGYVAPAALAAALKQGVTSAPCKWSSGVMGWQFSSDLDGSWSTQLAAALGAADSAAA